MPMGSSTGTSSRTTPSSSLDEELSVNGKLTDFGSSRNINMLMTNMTFTKGIGTPNYMAPEILNKEKYKKAADVYSFGVTMYECFVWGDAYPKPIFKYPWDVVTFVSSEKRLDRPEGMCVAEYDVVSKCWAHQPELRPCLFSPDSHPAMDEVDVALSAIDSSQA